MKSSTVTPQSTPRPSGTADLITVLIASNSPCSFATLAALRAEDSAIRIVDECSAGANADLLWLELADYGTDPDQWLSAVRLRHPSTPIILSGTEPCQDHFDKLVRYGIEGYLRRGVTADICEKAIRAVADGELWWPRGLLARALRACSGPRRIDTSAGKASWVGCAGDGPRSLTPREQNIAQHVHCGLTNKEIARTLGITENTVKKHLKNIFQKYAVQRRTALSARIGPATPGRSWRSPGE